MAMLRPASQFAERVEILISKSIIHDISYDVDTLEHLAKTIQSSFRTNIWLSISFSTSIAFLKASWIHLEGQVKYSLWRSSSQIYSRRKKGIDLAMTSPGIAATLLPGSRTVNSTFKPPINLTSSDSAICNISKYSDILTRWYTKEFSRHWILLCGT